jgi:hypothetical protein
MEIQSVDKRLKRAYFPDHADKKKKKKKRKGFFKKITSGKIGRIGKALASGGASEVVRNRKKIGKGLKKLGKLAVGAALLPAVLPLMPVMAAALKKKGLKPSKKPRALVEQFYKNIVKKNSHYDFQANHAGEDTFLPLAAVVPPVIKFVQDMIQRKKSGEKLSPVLATVADGSESVVSEIKQKLDSAPEETPGSNSKDSGQGVTDDDSDKGGKPSLDLGMKFSPVIIIILAVAAYLLFKK